MPINEFNIRTEVVEGWTFTVHPTDPVQVDVVGPSGFARQEFDVRDGDIRIDPRDDERGSGWDGDTASTRFIPVNVMAAAIRIYVEEIARRSETPPIQP